MQRQLRQVLTCECSTWLELRLKTRDWDKDCWWRDCRRPTYYIALETDYSVHTDVEAEDFLSGV